MVKIKESSEYDKLDALVREVCERLGLKLLVQGWTRKTYDVYRDDRKANVEEHLARVESFATTSGEIRIYREDAMEFASELGRALEQAFEIAEAVIIREQPKE